MYHVNRQYVIEISIIDQPKWTAVKWVSIRRSLVAVGGDMPTTANNQLKLFIWSATEPAIQDKYAMC